MHSIKKKKVLFGLLLIGMVGILVSVAKNWVQGALESNERSFNEKINVVQQQIAALGTQVQNLTGESTQVALSVKELQSRKEVREKSQDELLTGAVANITPSVVSIVISKDVPLLEIEYVNPFGDDAFFKDFNYRVPVYRQKGTVNKEIGAGTGFIVSTDGYVLTNRHVVTDTAATYTALLSDGSQKNGRVIFRDPKNDLAILKIDGGPFKAATLGDSSKLKLGQTVIAVGNALGQYNNSISVGIISGLNRTIEASTGTSKETLSGVIQTDAAINPGNSGGPLLDMDGKVIGINVATVIGSSNISFSIPSNIGKDLIRAYLK